VVREAYSDCLYAPATTQAGPALQLEHWSALEAQVIRVFAAAVPAVAGRNLVQLF
jgi:hypothetical protein